MKKTPIAHVIRASNPNAPFTLYLEDVASANRKFFSKDEIAIFVAMAAAEIAEKHRGKVRVEPPILPFVHGTSDSEHLWAIVVNDF
jgi:hypothetical protein